MLNDCPCINLNQLPRLEAVEGATFDRTFTLLDEQGNPYYFLPNAVCSFSVRTRMDAVITAIVATILPLPGQVRFQIAASQTTGRVGRFIWSGTIADENRVVVLEANEFYLKEGVLGEIEPEPPDPLPPPNPEAVPFYFADNDLSVAGILVITHNQGSTPTSIAVYDSVGEWIYPDRIEVLTETMAAINLESFRPLQGNWRLIING